MFQQLAVEEQVTSAQAQQLMNADAGVWGVQYGCPQRWTLDVVIYINSGAPHPTHHQLNSTGVGVGF